MSTKLTTGQVASAELLYHRQSKFQQTRVTRKNGYWAQKRQ